MKTVALGEIVEFYSGGTPAKSNADYWRGDVPWFSAKDMKRPRLADSSDHISDAVFRSTSLRKLPAGTIAIVVRGMILAHTVPISIIDVDAAINQDLKALLPKCEVDVSYLAAMLRAQHSTLLAQVSTAAHGTKKLDSSVLEEIRVPLPTMPEQRRIAAILDHADALRAKRHQVLTHLDALTQSIYQDMFGTEAHAVVRLDEVASVSSGITKGRRTLEPTRPVPYLAVANVQAGFLNLGVVKEIGATDAEIERYALRDGDLVLTEGGDPDKLGRGTVWRGQLPLCIHQNHIFRVRPDDRQVLPDYLSATLSGKEARGHFLRSAKQTTGIASINMTQLRATPVSVPSIGKQQVFLSRCAAVARNRAEVRSLLRAQSELFASLQSRAFRGEL